MIITIDGPSASGKSSIAQELAHRLGCFYLNSGMLYRALGYCLLQNGVELETFDSFRIKQYLPCINALEYSYDPVTNSMKVFYDKQEIQQLLKQPIIDKAASLLGQNWQVRDALTTFQRTLVYDHECAVVEGRDSGTITFATADIKFFLTAQPEQRAQRFKASLIKKNIFMSYEDALQTINERDMRDSTRELAPLIMASDMIVIDNSDLTFEQTLDVFIKKINKKREG